MAENLNRQMREFAKYSLTLPQTRKECFVPG